MAIDFLPTGMKQMHVKVVSCSDTSCWVNTHTCQGRKASRISRTRWVDVRGGFILQPCTFIVRALTSSRHEILVHIGHCFGLLARLEVVDTLIIIVSKLHPDDLHVMVGMVGLTRIVFARYLRRTKGRLSI